MGHFTNYINTCVSELSVCSTQQGRHVTVYGHTIVQRSAVVTGRIEYKGMRIKSDTVAGRLSLKRLLIVLLFVLCTGTHCRFRD